MGRLIDADALLQKFNDKGIQITFDLPVEEMLVEDVDIDDFSMLVQDAVQAYRKMVISVIQEQPTAFDVDAVIQQLDDRSTLSRPVGWSKAYEIITLKDAIETVRNGGKEI